MFVVPLPAENEMRAILISLCTETGVTTPADQLRGYNIHAG